MLALDEIVYLTILIAAFIALSLYLCVWSMR